MDTTINDTILWLIETLQLFDARLPRKTKQIKKFMSSFFLLVKFLPQKRVKAVFQVKLLSFFHVEFLLLCPPQIRRDI